MPFRRCMECRQLVPLGEWQQHRNSHRGNDNRGWSARNRSDQRRFRTAVLKRDGNQCRALLESGQRCPVRVGLVAHHTVPLHRGGDFDPAGGVTLCEHHHREVDTYAR